MYTTSLWATKATAAPRSPQKLVLTPYPLPIDVMLFTSELELLLLSVEALLNAAPMQLLQLFPMAITASNEAPLHVSMEIKLPDVVCNASLWMTMMKMV